MLKHYQGLATLEVRAQGLATLEVRAKESRLKILSIYIFISKLMEILG